MAGDASLSTGSLSFSGQLVGTTSGTQAVTLTNVGTDDLSITSIVANGDFTQTNNCGTILSVSGSCVINVSFAPTAIWGRGGSIVITDNASSGTTQTVLLAGMGNSSATAKLSPGSLTFGSTAVG